MELLITRVICEGIICHYVEVILKKYSEVIVLAKSNIKSSNLPPIFQLIKDNNFIEFEELLKNNIDLDERNNEGQTPLIYAASIGNSKAVKMILDRDGFDIDARDNNGNSAFMVASEKGYIGIVKMLLGRNASIDSRNSNNETALILAVENGKIEVSEFLIESGAKTNVRNSKNNSLLSIAVQNKNVEIVEILLKSGLDANIRNNDNETPILLAVENNDYNTVETLLKYKIDLSSLNKNKESVFDIALENEYFEIIKLLFRNSDKKIGLRYDKLMQNAAGKDYYEIFEILSGCELNIDMPEERGITPLMKAAGNANVTTVKKLIELGADVSKKDNDGDNALYHASAYDKDAWIVFGGSGSNGQRVEIEIGRAHV